jgi:hypothetical protein
MKRGKDERGVRGTVMSFARFMAKAKAKVTIKIHSNDIDEAIGKDIDKAMGKEKIKKFFYARAFIP